MINASSTFNTIIQRDSRTFRAKIMLGSSEVSCDIRKIEVKKGACDGDTFSVGSVFSTTAEITVDNLSTALENEDITLKIGLLTDPENDTYEYITYASLTVISVKKTTTQAVLTAAGAIYAKLNIPYTDTSATPSIQSIASHIAQATGVSVCFVGITSGLTNTLTKSIAGMTCRGALEVLAFLVGGYATENAAGNIEIHKFSIPQSPISLSSERCLTEPIIADEEFSMTGIKVIVEEEAYIITADTTVVSGKTYYTRTGSGTEADPYDYEEIEAPTGNPHVQGYYELGEISYSSGTPLRQTYKSEYMTASIFSNFAANIVGYEFMPASVDMSLGDPRIEPWDALSVTDINGDTFTVPCHTVQGSFDGGFSCAITSEGESESDTGVEGSITKQVSEMVGELATTQAAATLAKAAATQAKTAADAAVKTAGAVHDIAVQAQTDAGIAKASAENASEYAARALGNLSTVQSVTETLNWITAHGTMTLTTDTALDPTHVYFVRDADGDYEVGSYSYSVVTEPNVQYISTYYVLSIDESLNNYVGTHLSLTDEGLYVMLDGTSYKVLVGQSVKILNPSREVISEYGTSATIGQTSGQHIQIGTDSIVFYSAENANAYVAQDKFYSTNAEVSDAFYIGDYSLRTDADSKFVIGRRR